MEVQQIIQRIESLLAQLPDVRYLRADNSISVPIQAGIEFEVELHGDSKEVVVNYAGWHENFDLKSGMSAAQCFLFGLTDDCRLEVFRRGNFDYYWAMQYREEGRWNEDSVVGLFVFPFWRRKKVIHLYNNLVSYTDIQRMLDDGKES